MYTLQNKRKNVTLIIAVGCRIRWYELQCCYLIMKVFTASIFITVWLLWEQLHYAALGETPWPIVYVLHCRSLPLQCLLYLMVLFIIQYKVKLWSTKIKLKPIFLDIYV